MARTLIKTTDGYRIIEQIQVGDRVLTYDEINNITSYKIVTNVFVNRSDILVKVSTGKEMIESTPNRPFFIKHRGWIEAQYLCKDDLFTTVDNNCTKIESIEIINLVGEIKVYNFEVKDFHTYFVTTNNILVHNDCDYYKEGLETVPDDWILVEEDIAHD